MRPDLTEQCFAIANPSAPPLHRGTCIAAP